MQPLIVSLVLDEASQAFFDRLRRAHFPAGRLVVGAHITVFHALPPTLPVRRSLEAVQCPTFPVQVTGVRNLGRGVAYELSAPPVEQVRAQLVSGWRDELTAQDRQHWRPHVTVQNKVAPEDARRLHAQLSTQALPEPVTAQGLALWRYLGGPWEHLHTQHFTG